MDSVSCWRLARDGCTVGAYRAVDGEGLVDVRGDKVIVSALRAWRKATTLGRLGLEAEHSVDVAGLLSRRQRVPLLTNVGGRQVAGRWRGVLDLVFGEVYETLGSELVGSRGRRRRESCSGSHEGHRRKRRSETHQERYAWDQRQAGRGARAGG